MTAYFSTCQNFNLQYTVNFYFVSHNYNFILYDLRQNFDFL